MNIATLITSLAANFAVVDPPYEHALERAIHMVETSGRTGPIIGDVGLVVARCKSAVLRGAIATCPASTKTLTICTTACVCSASTWLGMQPSKGLDANLPSKTKPASGMVARTGTRNKPPKFTGAKYWRR